MTNFITMKNRIVDETLRDDLTSTQLSSAINDAIKQWEGERFRFNERRYLINTVTDQEYYPLTGPTLLTPTGAATPTGEMVLEIDSITATQSNWPYQLRQRTQQWFDEYAGPTYTGQPDSYGVFGEELRLFPIPDGGGPGVGGAYPLILSTLARLGPYPLVSDTDTSAWMTEGEALIRQYAKMLLYRDVLRDNDGAALAVEGAKEAEHQLKRKMAALAYTGRQRHTSL